MCSVYRGWGLWDTGNPRGATAVVGGSRGVLCGFHAATDLPSCLRVGSGSILIAQRRVEEGECKWVLVPGVK